MNKKKGLLRLLACIFAIVITVALLAMPISAIPEYRTGENSVSDAYKGGKYYQNLMNVTLSGDGVTDVLAVALSQLGYAEANSLDEMSGTQMGGENFTEFYYNFGKATNTWSMEWSAAFCSWALYQSGVSNQGNLSDWCRNHEGDANYIWREIGCSHWAEQLMAVGLYKTRGTYIPTSGDLIFLNGNGNTKVKQMGLVVWCDGTTVYTIEGNATSGNGTDGNGGGVYCKSYSLSSVKINGYGILPYATNDSAPKVDYSGANKTAGFYIAKSEFWVSAPSGGTLVCKIPQYSMFKVTGFDGQYAVIEYEEGRYYGLLNSDTLQVTADNVHLHNYVFTNDATHHMDTCECGERINVVQHDFQTTFDDNKHFLKCSCGYEKPNSNEKHVFEFVQSGDGHVQKCSCGYEKPESNEKHEYDIFASNENEHFYRCKCGAVDSQSIEAHLIVHTFDEKDHFDECEKCHRVVAGTKEAHSFDFETAYDKCDCGFDRSSLDSEHYWVIKYDSKKHYQECIDCGEIRLGAETPHTFEEYSNEGSIHALKCTCGYVDNTTAETHVYDGYGCAADGSSVHLQMCKCGAFLEGTEESHYYVELAGSKDEHWLECMCGAKIGVEAHTRENGTCSECGQHTHLYVHDDEGHWMVCDCDGSKTFEEHTFEDGICTVCEYSAENVCAHKNENGVCTLCGYHKHTYAHNEEGHWKSCGCILAERELVKHSMDADVCTECGYNTKHNSMHRMVNGTCADCGYHQHVYIYNAGGHKNVCDCYLDGKVEKHILVNGKCSVCDYDVNKATDTPDEDKVQVLVSTDGEADVDVSLSCGSVIGTTSAIFGTVMMLGCAVVLKKKEDS